MPARCHRGCPSSRNSAPPGDLGAAMGLRSPERFRHHGFVRLRDPCRGKQEPHPPQGGTRVHPAVRKSWRSLPWCHWQGHHWPPPSIFSWIEDRRAPWPCDRFFKIHPYPGVPLPWHTTRSFPCSCVPPPGGSRSGRDTAFEAGYDVVELLEGPVGEDKPAGFALRPDGDLEAGRLAEAPLEIPGIGIDVPG